MKKMEIKEAKRKARADRKREWLEVWKPFNIAKKEAAIKEGTGSSRKQYSKSYGKPTV
jgi:hypothetical protein